MDEATRRELLSSVDASGRPKWERSALEDLSDDLLEALPEGAERTLAGRKGSSTPGDVSAKADAGALEAGRIGTIQGQKLSEESWVPAPTVKERPRLSGKQVALGGLVLMGIALMALIPRIYFLYFVTDPDVLIPSWSNDTWHRWQIAYLSKEIGFSQGFLTLWDLKGLEYYWGVLHPLMLAGLFAITKSVDVMILRLLTLVAGDLNVVFFYLLGKRFWNWQVGLAAALFAALNPIVIFNDPSGMVEPLGFVFLLAGIYFFPRRSILAGILLALAAVSRAEAWLLSAGLVAAAMFSREPSHQKVGLALGWGLPILLYMKYLLDKTGNAIYPIYWNFLANAAGRWEFRESFTDYQLAARPVLGAVFVIAALAALWAILKRPRAYLIYLLGFGTTALVSGFIGLTHYLKSYEPWFWLTRFFVFPYMFAGLVLAAFFLGWLPSKVRGWGKLQLGWLAVLPGVLGMQLLWPAVLRDISPGYTSQTSVVKLKQLGEFVGQAYEGGTVLIPEGNPQFTYALGRYSGIPGKNLLGQMYGPIHYFEGGDPFEQWDVVGPRMWDWFEKEDVRLLVMNVGDERFQKMIDDHAERFALVGSVPDSGMVVYKVGS